MYIITLVYDVASQFQQAHESLRPSLCQIFGLNANQLGSKKYALPVKIKGTNVKISV